MQEAKGKKHEWNVRLSSVRESFNRCLLSSLAHTYSFLFRKEIRSWFHDSCDNTPQDVQDVCTGYSQITKEATADYTFKIADDMNYGWETCKGGASHSKHVVNAKYIRGKKQIQSVAVQGWSLFVSACEICITS